MPVRPWAVAASMYREIMRIPQIQMLFRRLPRLGMKFAPVGGGLSQKEIVGNLFWSQHLVDHLFIIRALILRELKMKHQGSRFGFFVEFIQPVFIIGVHYFGFTIMNRFMPGHIGIGLFVIGGFTTWFALSHSARGRHGKHSHIPLLVPNVTRMHSVVAGIAWECISNMFLCWSGVLAFVVVGGKDPLPNVVLSTCVYFIAGLVGYGIRLIFGALGEVFSLIHSIKVAFMWLMFFTGGVYFSASKIDNPFGDAVLYNPALHLLEYQRRALFPGYPTATVSLTYPIVCAIFLIFAGLVLDRQVQRWLRR
jgi:capsular polysaccharide transport system permease protein